MKVSGPASSAGVIKLLIMSGLQFYPRGEVTGVFLDIIWGSQNDIPSTYDFVGYCKSQGSCNSRFLLPSFGNLYRRLSDGVL